SRRDRSTFDLFPRTRRRYRRAGLRTNGIRRGIGRSELIASGIDEDAPTAIHFVKLLRQPLGIAAHELSTDRMPDARNASPIRFSIQGNEHVIAFGAGCLDPAPASELDEEVSEEK